MKLKWVISHCSEFQQCLIAAIKLIHYSRNINFSLLDTNMKIAWLSTVFFGYIRLLLWHVIHLYSALSSCLPLCYQYADAYVSCVAHLYSFVCSKLSSHSHRKMYFTNSFIVLRPFFTIYRLTLATQLNASLCQMHLL